MLTHAATAVDALANSTGVSMRKGTLCDARGSPVRWDIDRKPP
jgi:hypothetical protein